MTDVNNLINQQIAYNQSVIEKAKRENSLLMDLMEKADRAKKTKGIEKWLGFNFESSSGLTEEFASFNLDFKKYIKGVCGDEYELVNYNRGHFCCSGFIKRKSNNKLVYFSCSDVRFFPEGWYWDLLVRTAEHDKDWTGGSNHSYRLNQLSEAIDLLTN